jgi:hypothetical protein
MVNVPDICRGFSQQVTKLAVHRYLEVLLPEGFQGAGFKFPRGFYPENPPIFHSDGLAQK